MGKKKGGSSAKKALERRNAQVDESVKEFHRENLEAQIESLQSEVLTLEAKRDELDKKVKPLERQLKSKEERFELLQSEERRLQQEVKELESKKGPLQQQNEALEVENKLLQQEVEELKSKKEPLQREVDVLEAKNILRQREVEELQFKNETLEAENKHKLLEQKNKLLQRHNTLLENAGIQALATRIEQLFRDYKPRPSENSQDKKAEICQLIEAVVARLRQLETPAEMIKLLYQQFVRNTQNTAGHTHRVWSSGSCPLSDVLRKITISAALEIYGVSDGGLKTLGLQKDGVSESLKQIGDRQGDEHLRKLLKKELKVDLNEEEPVAPPAPSGCNECRQQ